MIRKLLLIAGLVCCAGIGRAEDLVTIKTREAGVGETSFVQKTETTTNRTVVSDPAGVALFRNESASTEVAFYHETVLAREGTTPTRLRRLYDKAQILADGRVADQVYAGKTILIEKQKDKYRIHFENGRDLTEDEARSLDKEFNGGSDPVDLEKLLVPSTAVRLQTAWRLDMAALVKEFSREGEMDIEVDKSSGTGTLTKTYRKGESLFGTMNYHLELPLKGMGKGTEKVVLDAGSKMTFQVGLDLCIDGTVASDALNGQMRLDATASVPLADGRTGKAAITCEVRSQESHNPDTK